MHCIIETESFRKAADTAGISPDERHRIITEISENPTLGDIIPGTGGARKIRFGHKNKGKSGGVRVITYFAADDIPVFLLDVYSKGERIDLSQAERNELRQVLAGVADAYRASTKQKMAKLAEKTA